MINLSQFSSFFVANWKLNGDLSFINEYLQLISIKDNNTNCVILCPPAIYLNYFNINNKKYFLGAQNISRYEQGAFTGEISPISLKELGIKFCIIGHSERRTYFDEKNQEIREKISKLIKNNIVPILCIGETLEQRNNGKTMDILFKQIIEGMPPEASYANTILAYEPVWAIGSGSTPSLQEINEVHSNIKKKNDQFNDFKILYGGSVDSKNIKEINLLSNVDGALVGGASLKIEEFNKIIS